METTVRKAKNSWKTAFIVLASLVMVALIVGIMFPVLMRTREIARQPASVAFRALEAGAPLEKYSPPDESVPWSAAWAASTPRMMISTADVRMEVSDVQKAHEKIADIARGAEGFLTESSVTADDGRKSAGISIRVPAERYQSVLAEVGKLGKVLSKDEKAEDVTEEYVDLQSRIRNLRREEEAFLKVLGRAGKVTDILAVERELSRVRGEIEQTTGRMKFLQNQTALATINIQLSEPAPTVSKVVNWNVFQTAVSAFNALQVVFRWIVSLVIAAVVFVPLWALVGAVVYGWKRYRRSRRTA